MRTARADVGQVRSEATFSNAVAQVSLMRSELSRPVDVILDPGQACSLDFCLSARESYTELRFSDIWHSERFEPAGRLIMRPPGQPIQIRSAPGSQRAISCRLQRRDCVAFFESGIQWSDLLRSASVDVDSNTLKMLLLRLALEMASPGFASELLCEALIIEILVELQRHFHGLAHRSRDTVMDRWRLDAIEARVRQPGRPPSMTELAGRCGLSVRQLSRSFLAARGVSLGRYVAQRTMEQARDRLSRGEAVKSVALGLGFSSPSSFCHAFRQATRMTPGEFGRCRR
jgi:AraC family transcriptional regulator